MREVFVDQCYALRFKRSPSLVFDLGSNVGFSVMHFRLCFPGAEIHAFEPDPRSFARLERNLAGWRGITLHHMAVAGCDGTRGLLQARETWASTLTPPTQPTSGVPVQTRKLQSLITELGATQVDLVKFDIEGTEWELLSDAHACERITAMVGELHFDMLPDSVNAGFLPALDAFMLSVVSQGTRGILHAERRDDSQA